MSFSAFYVSIVCSPKLSQRLLMTSNFPSAHLFLAIFNQTFYGHWMQETHFMEWTIVCINFLIIVVAIAVEHCNTFICYSYYWHLFAWISLFSIECPKNFFFDFFSIKMKYHWIEIDLQCSCINWLVQNVPVANQSVRIRTLNPIKRIVAVHWNGSTRFNMRHFFGFKQSTSV